MNPLAIKDPSDNGAFEIKCNNIYS